MSHPHGCNSSLAFWCQINSIPFSLAALAEAIPACSQPLPMVTTLAWYFAGAFLCSSHFLMVSHVNSWLSRWQGVVLLGLPLMVPINTSNPLNALPLSLFFKLFFWVDYSKENKILDNSKDFCLLLHIILSLFPYSSLCVKIPHCVIFKLQTLFGVCICVALLTRSPPHWPCS